MSVASEEAPRRTEVWRYPIREYQQRQPSLKHRAAGTIDERRPRNGKKTTLDGEDGKGVPDLTSDSHINDPRHHHRRPSNRQGDGRISMARNHVGVRRALRLRFHAIQHASRDANIRRLEPTQSVRQFDESVSRSSLDNAEGASNRQAVCAGGMPAFSFIKQHRLRSNRKRETDHFLLAGVEVAEFGGDFRGRAHLQPNRMRRKEPPDWVRGGRRLQLAMYGLGNENALEEVGQEILQLDQDQVVERRRVRRRSLRTEAIEIAAVLLEILLVVREIRLTFLQEGLRIPKRQAENAPNLLAA